MSKGSCTARNRFDTSGKTLAEWHHEERLIKLAGSRGLFYCAQALFYLQVHGAQEIFRTSRL